MVDNGGARRRAGRRGLWIVAGIAAAGAVFAVVGIWHLPPRMYSADATEARAALQGGLLTAAAALVAVAGALIALDETRQANVETRRANANTHVRELYTAAIGLLEAETVDGRLGGIYALERVAADSPEDQRTVVEVLSAFIREHTHPSVAPARRASSGTGGATAIRPHTDVQAALTVLGRLPVRPGVPRADLTGANLAGARLSKANLTGAVLNGADLVLAVLDGTTLVGAELAEVQLFDAILNKADLTGAWLHGVDLRAVNGLTQEQVDSAHGDEWTWLLPPLERPASWPPEQSPDGG